MTDHDEPEREFLGGHKDKIWTYLILLVVLLGIVIAINFAIKDPDAMHNGIHSLFGLPAWALATIGFALGALIFWLGLKVETDWPEALGAFLIAGSVTAFEFIIGWSHFELGLVVVPYIIPIVIFVGLLAYAMRNSV
jgi:hypothetical protein